VPSHKFISGKLGKLSGDGWLRYLIPLQENSGIRSRISFHFGRSPYYAIIAHDESADKVELEIRSVSSIAHGEVCGARGLVEKYGVDAVIVKGIGPRAIQILRGRGVRIYMTSSETLNQVMEEIRAGKLKLASGDVLCR